MVLTDAPTEYQMTWFWRAILFGTIKEEKTAVRPDALEPIDFRIKNIKNMEWGGHFLVLWLIFSNWAFGIKFKQDLFWAAKALLPLFLLQSRAWSQQTRLPSPGWDQRKGQHMKCTVISSLFLYVTEAGGGGISWPQASFLFVLGLSNIKADASLV